MERSPRPRARRPNDRGIFMKLAAIHMFAITALGNPVVIPIHRGAYGDAGDKRHEELIEMKGDLIVPLQVGESYPIEERESGVAPLTPVP